MRQSPRIRTIPINRESSDPHILLELVQFTLVSGRVASEMASENKPGMTEPSTAESGARIERMAREDLFTLMETFTMATGPTIKQMDEEYTSM